MKKITIFMTVLIIAISAVVGNAQNYNLKNQTIDFRPQIGMYGLTVRDQSPRGTCTIFAVAFLLEYMEAKKTNKKYLNYSEEYLNAVTNRSIGAMDDGSNFAEAMIGYGEYGTVEENLAPYKKAFDASYLQGNDKTTTDLLATGKNNRRFEDEILMSKNADSKLSGLSDEQIGQLLSQLDNGFPVAIGHGGDGDNTKTIPVKEGVSAMNEYDINNTKNPYAHTVPLVGYVASKNFPGGGYVIFRNTGGETWGDKGYGYMTFNYLKKYTYDALILKDNEAWKPGRIDLNLINKNFLGRKDILRQNALVREKVKLPYLTDSGLKKLDLAIKRGN